MGRRRARRNSVQLTLLLLPNVRLVITIERPQWLGRLVARHGQAAIEVVRVHRGRGNRGRRVRARVGEAWVGTTSVTSDHLATRVVKLTAARGVREVRQRWKGREDRRGRSGGVVGLPLTEGALQRRHVALTSAWRKSS